MVRKVFVKQCWWLATVLILLGMLATSAPGAPSGISIQGKLTGAGGKALTGTRAWRVQFWTAATGGSTVGGALTGTVGVAASGRFSFEVTPPAAAFAAASLYYELAIDSASTPDGAINPADVFPGRVKVSSVMYAQNVARQGPGSGLNADMLDGQHAGDFASATDVAGALAGKADLGHGHLLQNLGGAVTDGQIPDTITITEKDTLASVTGRGATTDKALKVTNSTVATDPGTGALVVSGGAGIGKSLHVAGGANIGKGLHVADGADIGSDLHVAGNLYYKGVKAFTWGLATTHTQMASGNGYIANNATELLEFTLPAALLTGDVVRVRGLGAGGWKIKQNDGQKILLDGLDIPSYEALANKAPNTTNWRALAMSADGNRILACAYNGFLYTSFDRGITWVERLNSEAFSWRSAAMTPDGSTMAACASNGYIYTSSDGGVTWVRRMGDAKRNWSSICVSNDGKKMAVCSGGIYGLGKIYTSIDGGANWTERESDRVWYCVSSSADGNKLAACASGGGIFISSNGGVNWTASNNRALLWSSVAMSADGTQLAAAAEGDKIYRSHDGGATWVACSTDKGTGGYWMLMSMSPDGIDLGLGENTGDFYTSSNGGVTWVKRGNTQSWRMSAFTSDRKWLMMAAYDGSLFASYARQMRETTAGVAGYLAGGPNSAVELQYLGNGIFMPLSHNGALGAK